ncbi:terpene synthase family protein [Streptomyces sp. NPDC050161]|uniref:terpene synthase family protein n=1 Tax=Streptomyces sp. NPDC050161 TaxID=3365604 RepID=UPI00378E4D63
MTHAPSRLLTPGDRYRLPLVACSSVAKVNSDYPTIYEENAAWVREFLPFPDADAQGRMLENRYPLWDSLVYPTGLAQRVVDSSCVTSLMFEVDDVALLQQGLFGEIADDWAAGHPYGPAFSNIWGRLEDRMPHGVYRRYREDWQDWFGHTLEENVHRRRHEIPDLDTYLDIRRVSVGLRPYIVAIEYVLDLDLTALLDRDRELNELKLLAVEHAMLANDLFSYRWECFQGDYFNAISPLLHVHRRTLQQAIDDTCLRIAAADKKLGELTSRLRTRYASTPGAGRMAAYFDAIGLFCAGRTRPAGTTATATAGTACGRAPSPCTATAPGSTANEHAPTIRRRGDKAER